MIRARIFILLAVLEVTQRVPPTCITKTSRTGRGRGARGGHVFEQPNGTNGSGKGTVGGGRRCPIGRRTAGSTVLFDKPVLPSVVLLPVVLVGHLHLHLQQRGLHTVHQFFLDVGGDVLHFRAGMCVARVAGWGWGEVVIAVLVGEFV